MTKTNANATVDESQQLTAANIAVVKAFLLSSKIEPDFGVVAEKIGISLKKNAPRDLKKALAKWGLDWKAGAVCELDDAANAANAPATPAKGADGASGKGNGGGIKRKVESDDSDDKGAASNKKKTPKKPTKVKSEAKVKDESEDGVEDGSAQDAAGSD